MPQRYTNARELYYENETTEGVDPYLASGDPPAGNAIKATNLMVSPDVAFYARSFVGQVGNVTGKIGAQTDPRLTFTVECRGGGSAITPDIDDLLKVAVGKGAYRVLDTGVGTTTAGTDEDTLVLTGYSGTFTAGNAVAVETGTAGVYEVGWIQSYSAGTITLRKPLSFNPGSSKAVKPSLTYRPMNTGHDSLSFYMYLDSGSGTSNRIAFVGCKGSLKLDAPAVGAIPTLTFNWKAIGWAHKSGTTKPAPSYDAATPQTPYKFRIDGADFNTKIANWDLRQVIARKRSQNSTFGTFAQLVTDRSLVGTIHSYDVDESQFTAWKDGTEHEVTHQFGKTQFNMVAYNIQKAQRVVVEYSDDNNLTTDWMRFQGNIASGEDELRLAFL